MRADFKVCLDACVLANLRVCDLLLRLAERPRMFTPVWSEEILDEVYRTHIGKLGWPKDLADYFQSEVTTSFPESLVDDYKHLIDKLENDEKDRHVLAATIRSGSSLVVTFNIKDFPEQALEPWKVEVAHPQDYLLVLYEIEPVQVVQRVAKIAGQRDERQVDTLAALGVHLPKFSSRLIDDLDLA